HLPSLFPLFPYTTLFRSGSVGFVINNVLSPDNLNLAKTYIGNTETSAREANLAARTAADVATLGMDTALRYGDVLARHEDISDEDRKSTRLNSSHSQISY